MVFAHANGVFLELMKTYSELSKKELIVLLERSEQASEALKRDMSRALVGSTQMYIAALQKVLDVVDEPVYIVDLDNHVILFANKKTEQLFGSVVGMRCWENLQAGQLGVCDFCTNPLLLDNNNQPTGVHKSVYKNELTNSWYQCSDQAFLWFDGSMVAIKASIDVSELKKVTSRLDSSLKENKAMTQGLVLFVEKERRKLSHDLHDEMGQVATAIRLNASFLASSDEPNSPQYLAATADIEQLATRLLSTVRGVSNRLNPRSLIELLSVRDMLQGLFDEWSNRNAQVCSKIFFEVEEGFDLDIELKETLYRIFQETLTNISKHANASQVEVSYRLQKIKATGSMFDRGGIDGKEYTHLIELEIADNGVGFTNQSEESGLGLKYMAERVRVYGGCLYSEPCERMGGVKILARFPYIKEEVDTNHG